MELAVEKIQHSYRQKSLEDPRGLGRNCPKI
jgi:hypothetical protein